jgi:hypothetical protein
MVLRRRPQLWRPPQLPSKPNARLPVLALYRLLAGAVPVLYYRYYSFRFSAKGLDLQPKFQQLGHVNLVPEAHLSSDQRRDAILVRVPLPVSMIGLMA